MKIAALDLGTNTFLMLIAEVEKGGITKVYRDELRVTRMGQGVHQTRRFHPEALARAEQCFRDFSEILEKERPKKILAMATSASRDVTNAEELFAIGNRYGIPITVIEGKLEAQITFEGATFDYKEKPGLAVIDVGGGSTEVIAMGKDSKLKGKSVDVGSVRLTELFIKDHPIPKNQLQALQDYAHEQFGRSNQQLPKTPLREVIAVAGTPTTLAAVMQAKPFTEDQVHGFKISKADLMIWRDRLAKMDLESRKALPGMDPRRADVMPAGICILLEALAAIGAEEFKVSARGVRYGVALHAAKN